ncbi:MAG: oxidoreductase [Xanthobacteraceae bacterium]|nr:oxidoreductase [Xanthobacteraceae bacterium]
MSKADQNVALITGASKGIGLATAKALQKAGFRVFGTSRRAVTESHDGITMLTCDVTDEASVSKLVDGVLASTGRIDLLVNNAGIGMFGGAEESSAAQVQALFDVNLFGVVRVINKVLPSMRQRGSGRIINISSILGVIPAPYSAHYSASKHALEGYSESLDHETRAFNVRVSLIEPAYTRSAFDDNAIEPDSTLREYDRIRTEVKAFTKKTMATAELPEIVGDVIVRAATDTRPRRRYTAGKVARQIGILRRFAPAKIFDRLLRRELQLPA